MSREKTINNIEEKNMCANKQHSYIRALYLTVILLFFLLTGMILYLTLGESFRRSVGEVVTQENAEIILNHAMDSSDSTNNSFETIMNYTWIFENGEAASANAYVENSPNNRNAFYFTVTLNDINQTVLYLSPNIAVGETSDAIKLNTKLNAGNYDAMLTYYLLDDSKNVTDTVEMRVELVVEG